MPVNNRIADAQPEIAGWRRHLHRRPELLYDVHETAAFVAAKLRDFGCDEVLTGLGRTGVVGLVHGRGGANGVMVAHSLPAPRKIEVFDKTVLKRQLTDEDYAADGSAHLMVWGRHQNQKIAQELADAWDVKAFLLGHQPAEMGWEEKAHNILILASDHGHGVCLPIDLSQTYSRDDLIDRVLPINGIRL